MTVSLFLILLTFFILLNSIAVLDDQRIRLAIGSLTGSFGSLPGGFSGLDTGRSIMPSSSPMVDQKIDLALLVITLDDTLFGSVRFVENRDRETITIDEKVLFEPMTHHLKPASAPLLDRIARIMQAGKYQVDIVGHTDGRNAAEKGYRSNFEVSGLMAMSVLTYLVNEQGIDPARLNGYGRGSQTPIKSNDTPDSREANRRVDIIFKYKVPPYAIDRFAGKPSGIFTYKRFNFKVFE